MSKPDKASMDARIRDVVTRRARQQAREAHGRLRYPEPTTYPGAMPVREWINSLAFRVARGRVLALTVAVTVALVMLWVSIRLVRYDAVGEIRLFSDYKAQPITDMAVDDRYVYLATDGNGLQRYDKQTYLWKTFIVPRRDENPSNSLREVVHDPVNQRLWVLSQEKNIFTADDALKEHDVETVLKTGTTWDYFDLGTALRHAFLADDGARIYFGSAGHGAATYHIPTHTWTPFAGASDTVRFLLPHQQTLWVAGNDGVHAFDRIDGGLDSTRSLAGEDIRHFALGPGLHTAVNADKAALARVGEDWTPSFGGGEGLRGVKASGITRALLTPDRQLIVAAEGKGLARYDITRHRWHIRPESDQRYRQLAVLGDRLLVAADTGLRMISYEDRFIPRRRFHGPQRVTLRHNNGAQLFYSTDDQALWTYASVEPRQLIDAPPLMGPPGAVRTVLAARHEGNPVFWLATTNQGLLRYNSATHRLDQGDYSFIDGQARPIDQLLQNGEGLLARIGRRIFNYTGGSTWASNRLRYGTKHVIPIARARFLFLKNNGSLEANNSPAPYFNGQTEPLLTAFDPTNSQQPTGTPPPLRGEVDPASGTTYLALPGEAVWAYQRDHQRWQRRIERVPADLQSMHWVDARWSLTTQAGRLYLNPDTTGLVDDGAVARVGETPDFGPSALPGPLNRVVDVAPMAESGQVLLAWPDRLALYEPGTGRWRDNTPPQQTPDAFEELIPWQPGLYARTASNRLWFRNTGPTDLNRLWHQTGFTDSAIADLAFSQATIWYRFADNTAGRFAATNALYDRTNTERFFTGSLPGLERATHLINENERYVWALTDRAVGRYDAETHSWQHQPFQFAEHPGETVRQALFANGVLYVITSRRLIRFMTAYDHIIWDPPRTFDGTPPMLLVPDGQRLHLWLKKGRQIDQLDVTEAGRSSRHSIFEGGRFEGNLNQLVDAYEHEQALWVMDRTGHFGHYTPRTHAWRNQALPSGETPVGFIPLQHHLILETQRPASARHHLYRYDAARDTLHRLDVCRDRPSFRSYRNGPLVLMCEDGSAAQVRERPDDLRIDPLPALDGATRLDFILTRTRDAAPVFAGLFEDSTGARTVLYGDTLTVALPASARGMRRLNHVVRDAADRLWILGDDRRLYVARFRNLTNAERRSLDVRHFEQKLQAGRPAIDFAAALWGGTAPPVVGFAVHDPSPNMQVWIATPSTLYKFFVPQLALHVEQRRARLPRGQAPVQHIHTPSGQEVVVVQEGQYYQLRAERSWWRRPFSWAAGYNLGDWRSLDAFPLPAGKPEPVERGYALRDLTRAQWRINRDLGGGLRFAFKPGARFKDLGHDAHTFFKDHILDAATTGRGSVYLYTRDGLLLYDLNQRQVVRELRTPQGVPVAGLDTLLSKPTGPDTPLELWTRQAGQWKQVVEVDTAEVRLEPGAYAYEVRPPAEDAVRWQQTTPTTTAFTRNGAAAVTGQRLRTDVLVDMAVLDSMVFYSTPAGTWWGSEYDEVKDWRFAAALANARFHETTDERLFARTDDGVFELASTGRMEPADALPPDTTRALRRNIKIGGTRWQMETRRPGLRAFSGEAPRRQDATTRAFADDIVRDAVFDERRNIYWVATQGGIWPFDPNRDRANRETVFAPETDFRRFFKDGRRLYALDAEGRVYAEQAGQWRRDDGMLPSGLVKAFGNGRVRFVQDHTNTVRLTRVPGQRGTVWTRHQSGWRLAGDALENAERVGDDLWTYASDLGFARYPMSNFSTAETVLQPPGPMPDYVDFFKPPGTDTLYARDPATDRYWRLIDDRLERGAARDWERAYAAASEGTLVWERSSPDAPTLTMKINGVPLRTAFSNRRLVFDDFRAVFAPNPNAVFFGNDAGLFEFSVTASGDLRINDYFPVAEGVQAIAEARGRIYVKTGNDTVRRLDPTRGTFAPAPEGTLFQHNQPVLRFDGGRFVLRDEPRDIAAFTGTLEVNLAAGRPLFTPDGTFGFDTYSAMLPTTDSTWLGATAWGLVEATASGEGTHQATAFHRFDQTFDGAVATIRDFRRHDGAVYLHGLDAAGRDVFFTWNGRRAQPYDEATRQIFAHPRVTFHPHDVKWNQERAPHTDPTVLKLVGDPAYPLYIEDADEPGRGRFSFDDIQSIWAYDNLLWAGSKGGLLQFRYLPDRTEPRLVFETIYTEQTNLTAYHVVDVQRGARPEPSVDLRQRTPADTLAKQTLVLGDWNAQPLDTVLVPVGSMGNLTMEQDALAFRTRLRNDAGTVLLEGYTFDPPPGKTARLGNMTYFVATDSLLFAYDQATNTSTRVGVVYAQDRRHPAETLRPPLALTRHDDQVVVLDAAARFFTMQPGATPDTAAARATFSGTYHASLGDLDFYVQDGQLVVEGGAVARMRVADAAGRYAVAAQDGKLFLYTGPGQYTVWTYEDGHYTRSRGGDAAFIPYIVRPGDTIYGIIAAEGLASGPVGSPAVERVKTQIINRNRGNRALYFDGGDARLRVRGRIEILGGAAAPRARRPTKGYFYWSDHDSLRLEPPSTDLITRALYAEDNTHSVFWSGERFVEVERKRNLAQQFYPPDSVAVWSLRRGQDGPFLLIPHPGAGQPAYYFERERLRLRPWEGPTWDPFVEHRVEMTLQDAPVHYRVTPRRLLERNGAIIRETDDWRDAYPIRRIVALEKGNRTLWVATRDRLIRVDPH